MTSVHSELYKAFQERYDNTRVTPLKIQQLCNEYWDRLKTQYPDEKVRDAKARGNIDELNGVVSRRKYSLNHYWTNGQQTEIARVERIAMSSEVELQVATSSQSQDEIDQSGLFRAIYDIVCPSGSAESKRRSDTDFDPERLEPMKMTFRRELFNRDIKDWNDRITNECLALQPLPLNLPLPNLPPTTRTLLLYHLSLRSALYLRVLPKNSKTIEGKRHVNTVPVKLCKAQNDEHRTHPDQYFCLAIINSMKQVASVLGPDLVSFISQDIKAKVPLRMTAAKLQAPILMHCEYKVRLPNHDFPVARPTYVAIRRAKHTSVMASIHAEDIETLVELEEFEDFIKVANGRMKPVSMISVDALAEIWSEMVIDGHPVVAKFIPCTEQLQEPSPCTGRQWYDRHVRESQYFLQVIKCNDTRCCTPFRSDLRHLLYQGFFRGPYRLSRSPFKIPAPEGVTEEKFPPFFLSQSLSLRPNYSRAKEIPYDLYCRSLKGEVEKRSCPGCGIHFAAQIARKNHIDESHKLSTSVARARPIDIIKKRLGEALCVLPEDTCE
ncbi:hypothetical protein QAD02_014119 [Eretmocerus hayati]|uniref:Uncharacterized protein n=1 Tax=Eretmocerus hayati TaxID=131215 RepID=A0ACC2P4N4_9HYME|nr:hypothetical protein QAD02_014119 [Eretmocerus hayati]